LALVDPLRYVSSRLRNAGIEAPEREAEILLIYILGIDRITLYKEPISISDEKRQLLDEMIQRRCNREPLQYITGECEFFGLKFCVGRGVLIPRPETEIVTEFAIKKIEEMRSGIKNVLDLCTGSGCIAISIARLNPSLIVYGIDSSPDAIKYAMVNASFHKTDNVRLICGDLFAPLRQARVFDLIVCNPPYIKSRDIKTLQPEIRDWEPIHAIDGGDDGLLYYRRIISEAGAYLKRGGVLIFETGDEQSKDVISIMEQHGFIELMIECDYSGMERVVSGRWINS